MLQPSTNYWQTLAEAQTQQIEAHMVDKLALETEVTRLREEVATLRAAEAKNVQWAHIIEECIAEEAAEENAAKEARETQQAKENEGDEGEAPKLKDD